FLAMIKPGGVGRELRATAVSFHKTVSIQVQAQLDAARMKTRRPIKLAPGEEVVPFQAVTHAAKAAEQRLPAGAHVAPGGAFGKRNARGRPFGRSFVRGCR